MHFGAREGGEVEMAPQAAGDSMGSPFLSGSKGLNSGSSALLHFKKGFPPGTSS